MAEVELPLVRVLRDMEIAGVRLNRDRLAEVVDAGYQSILMALAEEPAEVVCDLTGVTGPVDAEAVDLLASVGCEVEHWPGSRVGMICPDAALRRELAQHPDTQLRRAR